MSEIAGRPISPEEVGDAQRRYLPPAVFDVFNEAIAGSMNGKSARVMQNSVAKKIADRLGIERHAVFENNYLDVEEAYRSAGWEVHYDKPGYNESYEAVFVFTKGNVK